VFSYSFTVGSPFVDCPNTLNATFGGSVVITGLDTSQAGDIQGNVEMSQDALIMTSTSNCSIVGFVPHTRTYSGTWNGSYGGAFLVQPSYNFPNAGSYTASIAASPAFPMSTSVAVSSSTATVSASIRPRDQDVGSNGSVYVFAHAPASLVSGASAVKRDPGDHAPVDRADGAIVCVLAQVNSSGQLVAVSSSTMQAYLTGVLGSQAQAVQVLNSVPTPNVAGATVYVGYGSSAAEMLSSGVFQTAISVPGGVQCRATLASAAAPETPGPLTGLWWNPDESGWGIHFAQRSNIVVATWYTYDANGNPKWYIAPNCVGVAGTSGLCAGTVYQVKGPRFFATTFQPITPDEISAAGTLDVTFSDANHASLSYEVAGVQRVVAIQRQIFPVIATVPPVVDFTDLWWNPAESGWGMAITHQYGNIFLAWYVYDGSGNPSWLVVPSCTVSGSACSGDIFSVTGPPFGPSFNPGQVQATSVGSAVMSFVDANNAILSVIVNGQTVSKTLTRQIFP